MYRENIILELSEIHETIILCKSFYNDFQPGVSQTHIHTHRNDHVTHLLKNTADWRVIASRVTASLQVPAGNDSKCLFYDSRLSICSRWYFTDCHKSMGFMVSSLTLPSSYIV